MSYRLKKIDLQAEAEAPSWEAAARRRKKRILVLTVVTLVSLGIVVAFGSLDVKSIIDPPSSPAATFILYGLSMLNFLASMLLLFLLARNLFKLSQERREQKLGSKFKTKMVVGALAISIVPVCMLFFFAYSLINRSLDKWFDQPAVRFQGDVEAIRDQVLELEKEELADTGRSLVRALRFQNEDEFDSSGNFLVVNETTQKMVRAEYKIHDLARLFIIGAEGQTLFSYGNEVFDTTEPLRHTRSEVVRGEEVKEILNQTDGAMFVVVGLPIKPVSLGTPKPVASSGKKPILANPAHPVGGIFLVRELPPSLWKKFATLSDEAQYRKDLGIQNKRLKFTYLYILGFVTLLLVFGATWIGLYVARGVTVPIQALAEGTQKVAEGDFDIQVSVLAEDELAVLVKSFNEMAAQLRHNRTQLEATAVRLREMNQALEERHRYIETVLQSLFTGVVSLDAEHRLTTINQAGIELLGLENASLGAPFDIVVPSSNRTDFQRLLRRTRRLGQATLQMELWQAGRKPLHVAVSGTALRDLESHYGGAVLMIEDLSPLIQAQQSAVWSEVARRMAHEIKNPLTPIQLSAERISRNVERHGVDSDRARKAIAESTALIRREVATLQRMVDEFSRFAKLPDPRPEPSSLNNVVQDTVRLYEDRLDGIQLETRLDQTVPPLNLDREQFKRTLVNLIDNAMQAIEETMETGHPADSQSGKITLSTEYRPEQDLVRLAVADTGRGVAPEDRERLFQPYFSTRKRGTGLGLAIVSHIVTDHNGRILVEDNQPQGARFVIELPAA